MDYRVVHSVLLAMTNYEAWVKNLVSWSAAFEGQLSHSRFVQISETGTYHLLVLSEGSLGKRYLNASFLSHSDGNPGILGGMLG